MMSPIIRSQMYVSLCFVGNNARSDDLRVAKRGEGHRSYMHV